MAQEFGATSPSWFGVSREAQVPVTSPLITGQRGSHSTPNVHTQRTPIRPRAWPQRAAVTWPRMPGLALWLEWGHMVSHSLKGTRGPRLTSQSRTTGAGRRPWGAVTPRLAPGSEGTPALSYARRTLPFPGLTTLPSVQRAICPALPAAPLHSLEAWPWPRQTRAWFPRTAGHSRRCRLAPHGPLRRAGPGGRACVTCSAGRGRACGWTRPSYSHTRCLRRRGKTDPLDPRSFTRPHQPQCMPPPPPRPPAPRPGRPRWEGLSRTPCPANNGARAGPGGSGLRERCEQLFSFLGKNPHTQLTIQPF